MPSGLNVSRGINEYWKCTNMEILQGEEWRDVVGYEGYYQVSNFGRIKTVSRIVNSRYGTQRMLPSRIRCQAPASGGYLKVPLSKNKNHITYSVHRIVAEAYIPNPENKKTVNHKDGNKKNNTIGNLEWATHSENCKHAWDNGMSKVSEKVRRGSSALNALFTDDDVRIIRRLREDGMSCPAIAEVYNLKNYASIHRIVSGKSYIGIK